MQLAGKLLVAMPNLLDPNFYRSVVLVLEHDVEGTLGLVLNRKSALTTQELSINQGLIWRGEGDAVRVGGPVQATSLWVLYRDENPEIEGTYICRDCYLTTTLEGLSEVADSADSDRLVLAGYAGWGEGQLEQELRDGAWLSIAPDMDLVFECQPSEMWGQALRTVGVEPGSLVSLQSGTLQ